MPGFYFKFYNACLNARFGKIHENYAKCGKLDRSVSHWLIIET